MLRISVWYVARVTAAAARAPLHFTPLNGRPFKLPTNRHLCFLYTSVFPFFQ